MSPEFCAADAVEHEQPAPLLGYDVAEAARRLSGLRGQVFVVDAAVARDGEVIPRRTPPHP